MYAIIRTGGKQLRVTEGDIVRVERLGPAAGEKILFDDVLFVTDGDDVQIGQPTLKNVSVHGTVIEDGKTKKMIVFKYKRRKNYQVKRGHRQKYTSVRVDKIKV